MEGWKILLRDLKLNFHINGIENTIINILEILHSDSDKINSVVLINSRYYEYKKKFISGVLSIEESDLSLNKIKISILNLIDTIRADEVKNEFTKLKCGSPKYKKGFLVYDIPNRMEHLKYQQCIVRLSIHEELAKIGMDVDSSTVHIRSSIKIGDTMGVELISDLENVEAFEVTSINSKVQVVLDDDFSQWLFKVKPLKIGEYSLLIKISAIILTGDAEFIFEKVHSELINVQSESVLLEENVRELPTMFLFYSQSAFTYPIKYVEKSILDKIKGGKRGGINSNDVIIEYDNLGDRKLVNKNSRRAIFDFSKVALILLMLLSVLLLIFIYDGSSGADSSNNRGKYNIQKTESNSGRPNIGTAESERKAIDSLVKIKYDYRSGLVEVSTNLKANGYESFISRKNGESIIETYNLRNQLVEIEFKSENYTKQLVKTLDSLSVLFEKCDLKIVSTGYKFLYSNSDEKSYKKNKFYKFNKKCGSSNNDLFILSDKVLYKIDNY